MCGVGHSRQARLLASQCEGLFSPVARRYGVRELSLQRELLRTPTRLLSTFLENPSASHPKAAGHSAIAWLVAEAIQRGPTYVPALPTPLPAPAFLDGGWEHTDAPWACRTCVGGSDRCRALPALARDGWYDDEIYWKSTARGATLTLGVEGHTLLMTQCSDWDGGALVVLPSGRTSASEAGGGGAPTGASAGVAAPRSAGAVPPARRFVLDLKWGAPTGRHFCIADLGYFACPANVTLRVGRRPKTLGVKVQALITQQTLQPSDGGGVSSGACV